MIHVKKSSMSVGILLGSLVLLATYSDAAKIKKKYHDKRQISPPLLYQPHQSRFQYGHPLTRPYFPPPRYQYNSAFRNAAASIRPTKQLQSTGSRYSKLFKVQPQRQYSSYYYPHRTHYRDWSQKLVEASAFARKLQASRKQKLLQNQKSNAASTGIKLFVAGVNPNGNVLGQWIGQGKVQKPNGRQNQEFLINRPSQQNIAAKLPNTQFSVSARPMEQPVSIVNMNSGLPSGTPFAPKTNPLIQTSQPLQNTNQNSNAKTNVMSSGGAVIGASPFLDKESTTKLNSNGAIFSDSLGGAALGPYAHSLLQPTIAQQSGSYGSVQGSQIESKQPNANPALLKAGHDTNTVSPSNDNSPRQGQTKNVPSSNDQHPPINKGPDNLRGNSALLPLKNTAPPLPVRVPPSQMKAADKPLTGTVPGASQASPFTMTPAMKNMQPPKVLALESTNIDKSTAQRLNAGLTSTSASRPTSRQIVVKQPSTYNKNSGSRNGVTGNINRDQTLIDRELALKNILFPPPAASRNHVDGTSPRVASNSFPKQQPQQFSQVDNMIPSFPAFRYNANLPAAGQTGFNSYRRNNIQHYPSADRKKKSLTHQHNPVPYKSSFPLMLHKISPYFKMKRNLKQMASEQAKARRRFLELQPIK